jgi:tRNA-splicing ligase RtcB
MSRAKAKETLDLKEQQDWMAGIVHDMNSNDKLDESPGAYKDIDEVMEQQKDLVEIVTTLRPVASIKG